MKSLLIDTCTDHGIVAIAVDGRLLQVNALPAGNRCSQFLMPTIDRLLSQLKLNVNSISYLVVAVGPGSYTGIRVGVAAAKAMSFAAGIPIVSVSTFEGYRSLKDEPFMPMIDARSGGVYCWVHDEAKLVPIENVPALLKGIKTIVSPDYEKIKERLAPLCQVDAYEWEDVWPSGAALSQVGFERYLRHQYTFKGEVDILYLRETQAESELKIKKEFK